MDPERTRDFPISAGIFFGLGIGGFFDGIILHQVLQWHHMLTSDGYPLTSLHNLEVNTLWDGLFHITTYIFVLIGLIILWKNAHRTHVRWSGKLLVGTLLMASAFSTWWKESSIMKSSVSTMSTKRWLVNTGSIGIWAF